MIILSRKPSMKLFFSSAILAIFVPLLLFSTACSKPSLTFKELKTIDSGAKNIWSMQFSPDGDSLVSAGGDGNIKLWDTGSGELIRTFSGHTDSVYSVV